MFEPQKYIRYYPSELENYLFSHVSDFFKEKGHLTAEDFILIVIWKRKPSGIKVVRGLNASGSSVKEIMEQVSASTERIEQVNILLGIKHIGIAIASAVLTVCYPERFTVVDYRALNSLKSKSINVKIDGDSEHNAEDYLKYVDVCIGLAERHHMTLREFDRSLWGKDYYEGENGVTDLVEKLANK